MLDKNSFRIYAKSKLKSNKNHQAKCVHYSVLGGLQNIIKNKKTKNILLYIPTDYEVDVLRLRQILSKNINIFVPFMLDESLKIVKLRLPFTRGRFNILQANDSNGRTPKIDLAIIPVIGVDANMARIGHGKGFYDRFFSSLNYMPCVIFVSILDLFIWRKICCLHDIRAEFYLTPYKIYKRTKHDTIFRFGASSLHADGRRISWLFSSSQDKRSKLRNFCRASKG